MQSHPEYAAVIFDRRNIKGAAVFNVSTDRMTKFCKMDSDLVGSARFQ